MDERLSIAGLTRAEFEEAAGLGPGRSRALGGLYRSVFAEGAFEPRKAGVSPEATRRLEEGFCLAIPEVLSVAAEEGESGTTAKAVLRLADGKAVECVRIPVARHGGREGPATLCVSSQVGCRMGCAFCETGLGGLERNLTAAEIVGQLIVARAVLGWEIGNLVFMGMGEPLDNFDEVAQALSVLLDGSGAGFSQESITLCTVGLPAGIERLKGLALKRLNLSVSLNAGDDPTRSRLMPTNRASGLDQLAAALLAYPQRRNFTLAANYCLIPGVNDGAGAEKGVASFLRSAAPPGRAIVNLIPYNPGSKPIGRAPEPEEVEAFRLRLAAEGLQVKLRSPRGRSLMAACGQLGRSGTLNR